MDLTRALRRLYGLGCYAVGGVVTPYLLLFAGDVGVPLTVNRGLDRLHVAPHSPAVALLIDLALISAFGLQHSLMALPAWKRWLGRRLPPSLERSSYVLAASLVLAGAMLAWQPLPGTAWQLDGLAAHVLTAGYIGGFAVVYLAALWLDHFHLLGLRQAWTGAIDSGPDQLTLTGPYRFVRHPLMTGLLLAFWCTPHMTWSQLVFAAGMTGYVVVGTLHEERALIRRFGDAYTAYARLTPMLIPSLLPVLLRYRAQRGAANPALVVRRPDIEFTQCGPAVWYADNVVATAMLTAYSALFPSLERFMSDELRATLPDIRDPELARAVRDFVGQESMHAHEHARSLLGLAELGYRVAGLERAFAAATRAVLRPLVRRVARPVCAAAGSIAIFAGVEHWTAVLAEATLRRHYPPIYSPIAALYYWHGAEELEHRSVVADVLAHLGRSYLVRITMFAFGTLAFGLLTLFGTVVVLAQIPALQGRGVLGWLVYPVRVVRDGVAFCLVREKIAWHMLWGALRYMVPFYHPDGIVRRRPGAELAALGLERAIAAGAVPRPLRRADA